MHLLNSFTGKTLKSLETVTLPSGSSNWLEAVYSYDSRERLSSEVATLDGEATQTLDYYNSNTIFTLLGHISIQRIDDKI